MKGSPQTHGLASEFAGLFRRDPLGVNIRPLGLVGFMGSGKSVVGALVAQRTNSPFRELEAHALPGALEPGAVVALGGGSLINDESWRLVASTASTVYLEVPFEVIWERIRNVTGRPLASGRSRDEVEALFERRRPRYERAMHRVDGSRPVGVVADEVIKLWSD